MRRVQFCACLFVGFLLIGCGDDEGDKQAPQDPIIGTWKGSGSITWQYGGYTYAMMSSSVNLTFTHPDKYSLTYTGMAASGASQVNVEWASSGTFAKEAQKTSGDIIFTSTNLVLKYNGMVQQTVNGSETWTYTIMGTALSLKRTQLGAQANVTLSKQ